MRTMIGFVRALLGMPWPWVIWVGALMTVNMVVPLFFLGSLEARVVLGAFMLGAVIQMTIFSARGFVRLLGVGHAAWIPLVAWLATRVGEVPAGSFRSWLIAVIVLDSLSLVIDAVDVVRYARGERGP